MAENTGAKRHNPPPVEHQFKPGNSGRPKGARNKLGEAFIEALHESFKTRGVEAIEKVIDEKPEQYLKVIASLMPKDVNLNINDDTGEMSDDELAERIQRLTAAVAPFLDRRAGNDQEATGTAATTRVH
jgi:hypothetical protein